MAYSFGSIARWPVAATSALWPSLGGHFVEVYFLNGLRPRLPGSRFAQTAGRLLVWFAAGAVLFAAMAQTAAAFGSVRMTAFAWWTGGVAFIGVELVAHLALHFRGRPSFYDGRG